MLATIITKNPYKAQLVLICAQIGLGAFANGSANYSKLRWILPETVFGSSSLKTTMRGYL